ncbi:hypothetical protein CROQUDRAFT_241634 [Cronartium quercuum f. sp. fusiforme G11]|uniref:Uncharacterized protein n=1 Tax=Cronartium quercuum f. sp. fusiforme G11 TaxID=708437 RepID=A0A9P6NAB9_9BASI|nr:hypothetical protein CROQUDRAFT_241634 [Cronartium quercuum f. sp. fusiforme G11]
MLIFFLLMIGIHWISFHKLSKWFHNFFGPAADFLLGQMGLFFTSSFILFVFSHLFILLCTFFFF